MLTPAEYWDREVTTPVTPVSHSWMANLAVRHYINRKISGSEGVWPMDWFAQAYGGRKFRRALSIGCGTGALERDLLKRNLVETIDAVDASEESLRIARETAASEGVGERVRYDRADFNRLPLPARTYDLVCFHQSLHHVVELERLMQAVRRTLTADGIVYLDEFIGPSRDYWTEERIRWYRAMYELFPRNVRYFDVFAMPIQHEDPSEAIRSDEIVSRLAIGFELEQFRGYGGNLLAMMFPDLDVPRLTDAHVEALIRAEDALIAAGDPHFHAVMVWRPKRGAAAGAIASLRYSLEALWPTATGELRNLVRFIKTRREERRRLRTSTLTKVRNELRG